MTKDQDPSESTASADDLWKVIREQSEMMERMADALRYARGELYAEEHSFIKEDMSEGDCHGLASIDDSLAEYNELKGKK